MKLSIDEDGAIRLPDDLLERWGVSRGRTVEASVERGRLVLQPRGTEGDPFTEGLKKPDEAGFDKAMERDAAERSRARDAFDRALREKPDIDMEKEREERDRWR